MEKQFFEDLGKYGVVVKSESYEGIVKDSFHVTIGEFSFSFRGENKENEIIVEYPFWNQYVFGEKVNVYSDEECKRLIEALIEIDQYMNGQSYTPTFQYEEKEQENILTMKDLLLYARKRGAVIEEAMDDVIYFGHWEEEYEEDKLFVKIYIDVDGNFNGKQTDDGEDSISYSVFPNAEIFDFKKEYINIGDSKFRVLYAVLNKENVYADYPIKICEKGEVKMIYDLEKVEKEINIRFKKSEIQRKTKGLSMYAYNWLQKFEEERLKERMQDYLPF